MNIPGYKVIDRIGVGGMATVYRAVHRKLGRQVAVKVIKDALRENLKLRRRFQNEARIMARLNHPNVVQLFDYMEIDNHLVLIIEYVPGSALDVLIRYKTGPVPYQQAVDMFQQILKGIDHLHNKGIVHRDIKPSNILIRKDDSVKVSDMGISKLEGQKTVTNIGDKLGSLYYMAPELVQGGNHTIASDIYALGMTFYEALSGRVPLDQESSVMDLMQSIVELKIADPREYYPSIPESFVQIVLKMLSKTPADRYQSCQEVMEAISEMRSSKDFLTMDIKVGEGSGKQIQRKNKSDKNWFSRTFGFLSSGD